MGWLEENTDYVVQNSKTFFRRVVVWTDGSGVEQNIAITTTTKSAGSMTKAGAEAQANAYKIAHPTAEVEVRRQNDSGAYEVVISETTRGAWEEDT